MTNPADLIFPNPQVSRRHAQLEFRDGGYYLTDLGSSYGTFCQGQPLESEPVRIRDGDEVVLGGALSLRFCDPAETAEGRRVGRLKGLWLDESNQETWLDARLIAPPLSAAQFNFLKHLLAHEGQFLSRAEIFSALWPEQSLSNEALDALIKRVRARLREVGGDHWLEVKRKRGIRLAPAVRP